MEDEKPHVYTSKVHRVLINSYSVYFLALLIGVYLDFVFDLKIFRGSFVMAAGFILLMAGTFLIVWAQKTSRDLNTETLSKETFTRGPYHFTRTPTNFGLFFLMLGFGLIANGPFIIILSLLSFIVAKFIFLEQEEKILAEKYGTPYLEYKKTVKF
jgi:protein-S-isoprenylcysteine O-methyltransferase Ste14